MLPRLIFWSENDLIVSQIGAPMPVLAILTGLPAFHDGKRGNTRPRAMSVDTVRVGDIELVQSRP